MAKLHLIMPMAGAGTRFLKEGVNTPKPLIMLGDRPFFWWAVMSVLRDESEVDITFVVLKCHIEEFGIDDVIHSYFRDARIVALNGVTDGPALTCLEGVRSIEDDAPVMFNDCDHYFRCKRLCALLSGGLSADGVLLTFKSDSSDFSYARFNDAGQVIGTIEKQVVSDRAICGAYVFKSAALFRTMCNEYLEHCEYKECFVSGIYNVMCNKGMNVEALLCDEVVSFGTLAEYEAVKGRAMWRV